MTLWDVFWDEDGEPVCDEDNEIIVFDDEQAAEQYAEEHDIGSYDIRDTAPEWTYDEDGVELLFDSEQEAEDYAKEHDITNFSV